MRIQRIFQDDDVKIYKRERLNEKWIPLYVMYDNEDWFMQEFKTKSQVVSYLKKNNKI